MKTTLVIEVERVKTFINANEEKQEREGKKLFDLEGSL